ncbi:sugar transferase [Candidatus Omnitrophota bacterium]
MARNLGNSICDLADFILAVMLFVVSLPLFLLAAFLVKVDSPGPLFYTQKRYSKDKKLFLMYKFRSLKHNIEKENGGPVWGDEHDSRSSSIGRFLRCTHIDELPQLFNVLKGEMSVVGPRPERPYFAERFKDKVPDYEKRYNIKPGMTGLAQISGWRGNSSITQRTKLDIFYIKKRSLYFNLKILLLTPFAKPVVRNVDKKKDHHALTFSHSGESFLKTRPLKTPTIKA